MDDECITDDLLEHVVRQGKEARQRVGGVYDNPETAWLDGYVEACNDLLFHLPSTDKIKVMQAFCQVPA